VTGAGAAAWSATPRRTASARDALLPQPLDWAPLTAQAQQADERSTLAVYKAALRVRKASGPGRRRAGVARQRPPGRARLERPGDDAVLVVLNTGSTARAVDARRRARVEPAGVARRRREAGRAARVLRLGLPTYLEAPRLAVAGVTFLTLVRRGVRSSSGIFLVPVSDEFGWSREVVSLAITCSCSSTASPRPSRGAHGEVRCTPDRRGALVLLALGMAVAPSCRCRGSSSPAGACSSARRRVPRSRVRRDLANRWFVQRRAS